MPTLSFSSAVRTIDDNISLSLRARHVLVSGIASKNVRNIKGRLLESMDVIVDSDLVITLAGVVDIPDQVIAQSAVARRVADYFRVNAEQLGLSTVADPYVDKGDGRIKFSLTSSRPPLVTQRFCLRLASIDVQLACQLAGRSQEDQVAFLFSGQAYMPLLSALDGILEKFVSNQLVRRYPLVFGPHRDKLDAEALCYPSVSRSFTNVARRSPNPAFKKQFHMLLNILEEQEEEATTHSIQTLDDFLGNEDAKMGGEDDIGFATGHNSLSQSLERLLRRGVRPLAFKGSKAHASIACDDDDDERLFDLSGHRPRVAGVVTFGKQGALNQLDDDIIGQSTKREEQLGLDFNWDENCVPHLQDCSDSRGKVTSLDGGVQDDIGDILLSDDDGDEVVLNLGARFGLYRNSEFRGPIPADPFDDIHVCDDEEDLSWASRDDGGIPLCASRTNSVSDDCVQFPCETPGVQQPSLALDPFHSCLGNCSAALEPACDDHDLVLPDLGDDCGHAFVTALSRKTTTRDDRWQPADNYDLPGSMPMDYVSDDDSIDFYPEVHLESAQDLDAVYGSDLPPLSPRDIRCGELGHDDLERPRDVCGILANGDW